MNLTGHDDRRPHMIGFQIIFVGEDDRPTRRVLLVSGEGLHRAIDRRRPVIIGPVIVGREILDVDDCSKGGRAVLRGALASARPPRSPNPEAAPAATPRKTPRRCGVSWLIGSFLPSSMPVPPLSPNLRQPPFSGRVFEPLTPYAPRKPLEVSRSFGPLNRRFVGRQVAKRTLAHNSSLSKTMHC